MKRLLSLMLLCLCVFSCQQKNAYISRYYEDGKAKPEVALVPIIDSSSFDLSWSLTEEFTAMTMQYLNRFPDIFLSSIENTQDLISSSDNPFGTDISWIKTRFSSSEFVVFAELMQHSIVPSKKDSQNSILNMSIRLRIVDNRFDEPKIILQEQVNNSTVISYHAVQTDYNIYPWGSKEFKNTRMGVAHAQITHDLVDRIHDYVTLAKSR